MRKEDVDLCCRCGVEVLGFVTCYPAPVPWNLTEGEVKRLLAQTPPSVARCIVTGGQPEKIIALGRTLRPELIQLHAQETLEDVRHIAAALAEEGIGVIKAIPPDPQKRAEQLGNTDPGRCALLLEKVGAAAVLVDSRTPESAAAPGKKADLSLFQRVQAGTALPAILAGGITPNTCRSIVEQGKPVWIDVMTGVERSPGLKDPEKVASLVALLEKMEEGKRVGTAL